MAIAITRLMQRRELIAWAGLSVLPLHSGRAQEGRLRKLGVLMSSRRDPEIERRLEATLPVQFPPDLKFVVNLKTARMLGLAISNLVITRADEVIE